jgi:hypothetical protein
LKETASVISGFIKRGQASQAETAKTDRALNAAAEAEIKRAGKVRDEGLKAGAERSAARRGSGRPGRERGCCCGTNASRRTNVLTRFRWSSRSSSYGRAEACL